MSPRSLRRQETFVRALQPVGTAFCMCASASPLASRAKARPDWRSHQVACESSEHDAVTDSIPSLAGFRKRAGGSVDTQGCLPRTGSPHDVRNPEGKQTKVVFRHSGTPSVKYRLAAARAE